MRIVGALRRRHRGDHDDTQWGSFPAFARARRCRWPAVRLRRPPQLALAPDRWDQPHTGDERAGRRRRNVRRLSPRVGDRHRRARPARCRNSRRTGGAVGLAHGALTLWLVRPAPGKCVERAEGSYRLRVAPTSIWRYASSPREEITIMLGPGAVLLLLLIIGIAAGLLFDRFAGPGWLSRQIAGGNRTLVTSALVGIAGSFVGYHLALVIGIIGYGALIVAVVGALAVLWAWRTVR